MKKFIVTAAVLAALLLASAAAALAQEEETKMFAESAIATREGSSAPPGPPGSNIPDCEFRGGWVYVDGDVAVNCEGFAGGKEYERTPDGEIPAGALRALEECADAGLLPAKVAASVRASSYDSSDGGGGDELPDTGGPGLWTLLAVSGALLAAGGLLARKVAG